MSELATFLNARLDEDEEIARATSRPAFREWHVEPWHDGEFLNDRRTVRADLWGHTGIQFTGQGAIATVIADHVARQDPMRVLRDVEAKRAIMAAHAPDPIGKFGSVEKPRCLVCLNDRDGYEEQWEADSWPCLTLRALAAIYSDHEDYREEWALGEPVNPP